MEDDDQEALSSNMKHLLNRAKPYILGSDAPGQIDPWFFAGLSDIYGHRGERLQEIQLVFSAIGTLAKYEVKKKFKYIKKSKKRSNRKKK